MARCEGTKRCDIMAIVRTTMMGLSVGRAGIYSVTGIKESPQALCTSETYKATISLEGYGFFYVHDAVQDQDEPWLTQLLVCLTPFISAPNHPHDLISPCSV